MSESHPATAIATLENEEADDTNLGDDAGHDVSEPSKPEKGKAKAAPPAREPGKSLLPAARVSKILKADEDLCLVQREAQLLIALATERFMQAFALAMLAPAERERRTTISAKDVGIIGRSADRFLFLQEMLPELLADRPAAPKKAAAKTGKKEPDGKQQGRTMLDGFVTNAAHAAPRVVQREDGTMELDE